MKKNFSILFLISILAINSTITALAATPRSTSIGTRWGAVVDTTDAAEEFNEHMENIGFRGYLETIPTINKMNSTLLENNVLMFAGHGSPMGVFFNYKYKGGDYATGIYYGDSKEVIFEDDGETYQMAGMGDYDWNDTLLAIFCACKTGKNESNITKAAYENGVDFSIGWREITQTEDLDKWLSRFGTYLENGMMLIDAMTKASNGSGYTDKNTVRNIAAFSSSISVNNLVLSDYVNNYRSSNNKTSNDNIITVNEDIEYSFDKKDMTDVEKYIRQNIDSQFDINRFDINDYINVIVEDSGDVYGSLFLDYKVGDFVTEDGYYIAIKNSEVKDIYINGNPSCSRNDILTIKEDIDEDELKLKAIEQTELGKNEEIVEQKIIKKYDTEPYYVVVNGIENKTIGAFRGESFEYRF